MSSKRRSTSDGSSVLSKKRNGRKQDIADDDVDAQDPIEEDATQPVIAEVQDEEVTAVAHASADAVEPTIDPATLALAIAEQEADDHTEMAPVAAWDKGDLTANMLCKSKRYFKNFNPEEIVIDVKQDKDNPGRANANFMYGGHPLNIALPLAVVARCMPPPWGNWIETYPKHLPVPKYPCENLLKAAYEILFTDNATCKEAAMPSDANVDKHVDELFAWYDVLHPRIEEALYNHFEKLLPDTFKKAIIDIKQEKEKALEKSGDIVIKEWQGLVKARKSVPPAIKSQVDNLLAPTHEELTGKFKVEPAYWKTEDGRSRMFKVSQRLFRKMSEQEKKDWKVNKARMSDGLNGVDIAARNQGFTRNEHHYAKADGNAYNPLKLCPTAGDRMQAMCALQVAADDSHGVIRIKFNFFASLHGYVGTGYEKRTEVAANYNEEIKALYAENITDPDAKAILAAPMERDNRFYLEKIPTFMIEAPAKLEQMAIAYYQRVGEAPSGNASS